MPFNPNLTDSTCADIVFVIDGTGSMSKAINTVKELAVGFRTRVMEKLAEVDRSVEVLRVRVITFRDFSADTDALVASPFFTLPDEEPQFLDFIGGIEAVGGGDEPENALEALAEAMNSEWTADGTYRRHIIVLFTDASAIKFEDSDKSHTQYPSGMPKDLAELQDWWEFGTPNGALEKRAERLIIFAPASEPWTDVKTWNQVETGPAIKPGEGCAEATMEKILALIGKSFATTVTQ